MNVLLINPPVREEVPPVIFPLGVAYLVTCLKRAKHNPVVVDIDGNRFNYNEALKIIKKHLEKNNIEAICTGGLVTVYKYCKRLTNDIRKINPNVPIIIGGSLASSTPELVLEKIKPNYIVFGEGEIPLTNLINCLEKKIEPKDVKGIGFKENNKITFTPKEEPLNEEFLNNLLPDWDEFPIEKYIKYPNTDCGTKKSMGVTSMRGCPFRCKYCYHIFEKTRMRSPESLVNEINILKRKYSVEHIIFSDDLFTVSRKRVEKLCELIVKQKLNVTWSCCSRVNLVDLDLLKKMKKAGCILIGYGFESGSQKILDLMGKRAKVEEGEKAIEMTRKAGISIRGAFMIGFPGETKETFEETIQFCLRNNLTTYFSFTDPYPGTEIFYSCEIEKKMDLEKFVENIGEQVTLRVNLTDLPDKELLEMCDKGEKKIAKAGVIQNFPLNILLFPFFVLGIKKYATAITQSKQLGFGMFLKLNIYYLNYKIKMVLSKFF
ncbi:hypothetical protein CEE44_02235 [Candidatus Woesearchaeota archaeon B3_Woes]|nr:MAG: hypothetical protein CEE44_02235 [Candidatus Woesearchaeota archaeon B3_Woes]